MRNSIHSRQRQGGAVAIVVGLSLIPLVGMLALVLDLGHLYIAKTELQNAADAAALAGAKELNETMAGVTRARNLAIEAAGKNKYDLNSRWVEIAEANIEFSDSPDGGWVSVGAAQDAPAGKTFLKVHTGSRTLTTWFAGIWNIRTTETFGMAVAGRDIIEVAPLGVCAVDELAREQGFIRGVAYNVPELTPLANADQMWINPVSVPPSCTDLESKWNSTRHMTPFVCTGKSAVVKKLPGQVFVNTGTQAALDKALNSRFVYDASSKCDATTAPPDTNIKEYRCTNLGGTGGCLEINAQSNKLPGLPRVWMDPDPTRQGIEIRPKNDPAYPSKPFNYPASARSFPEISTNFSKYGVLWSHSREMNFATDANYALTDWTNLYGGQAPGYPTTVVPPATFARPYSQTSGIYFEQPNRTGTPDRRVLSLLIIDCSNPPQQVCSGQSGKVLNTLAVGKFFMPVKAKLEGTPKQLFLEFVSSTTTMPPAGIKLY